MSERNKELLRQCRHCDFFFTTTAAGIKAHADKCKKDQRPAATESRVTRIHQRANTEGLIHVR